MTTKLQHNQCVKRIVKHLSFNSVGSEMVVIVNAYKVWYGRIEKMFVKAGRTV